jgi:outer membrane protein assembly factor BamB
LSLGPVGRFPDRCGGRYLRSLQVLSLRSGAGESPSSGRGLPLVGDIVSTSRIRRVRVGAVVSALASCVALVGVAGSAGATTSIDQWASSGATAGQARANLGEHILVAGQLHGLHDAWSQVVQESTDGAAAILGGVAYTTAEADGPLYRSAVIARSAVTGAIKWQTSLPTPDEASIVFGVASSGGLLIEPVDSPTLGPGLIALSPATGHIVWEKHLPATATDQIFGFTANDGIVFVQDGNLVQARRSSSGALVWSLDMLTVTKYWEVYGSADINLAAGDGALFVDTAWGLYSLNESTGHVQWSADIQATSTSNRVGGTVAAGGGHVFVSGTEVEAFAEQGCGASVCTPIWTNRLGNPAGVGNGIMSVGAVTSTTLAVYAAPSPVSPPRELLASLNAATGTVRWTATLPATGSLRPPIQGGNVVWIQVGFTIEAFPVSCAKVCAPTASITGPNVQEDAGLSIADGSLFVQSWSQNLDVYRN